MGFFTSLHQFSDFALLILRLALGTVFLFHGLPKKGLWSAQPSDQLPAGLLTRLRILSIAEPAGARVGVRVHVARRRAGARDTRRREVRARSRGVRDLGAW